MNSYWQQPDNRVHGIGARPFFVRIVFDGRCTSHALALTAASALRSEQEKRGVVASWRFKKSDGELRVAGTIHAQITGAGGRQEHGSLDGADLVVIEAAEGHGAVWTQV
jgi:hypothetical protein